MPRYMKTENHAMHTQQKNKSKTHQTPGNTRLARILEIFHTKTKQYTALHTANQQCIENKMAAHARFTNAPRATENSVKSRITAQQ